MSPPESNSVVQHFMGSAHVNRLFLLWQAYSTCPAWDPSNSCQICKVSSLTCLLRKAEASWSLVISSFCVHSTLMALKNNVLVPLGQYYTINWVAYKKQKFVSISSNGRKIPRSRCRQFQCLMRGLLSGSWMVFLLGPHMQEGAGELSVASLIGVLPWPNYLPKVPPLNAITLGK